MLYLFLYSQKCKHTSLETNDDSAGVEPSAIEGTPSAGITDMASNFNAAEQLKLKLRGSRRSRSEPATLQPGEAEQPPDPLTTGEEKKDCTAEGERKESVCGDDVSHAVDGENDQVGNSGKEEPEPSNEEQSSLCIHPDEMKEAQEVFDVSVKNRIRKNLDDTRDTVQDNVRLWEPGWKDRYYSDKCKVLRTCLGRNVDNIADIT